MRLRGCGGRVGGAGCRWPADRPARVCAVLLRASMRRDSPASGCPPRCGTAPVPACPETGAGREPWERRVRGRFARGRPGRIFFERAGRPRSQGSMDSRFRGNDGAGSAGTTGPGAWVLQGAAGVRRLLLAHPHAGAPPPAHDPGHRLRLFVPGLAEAHPFHRLADVVRRQPFEHHRGVEVARRAPGPEGEELRTQLPRALAPVHPPQLPHPHLPVAFGLARIGVRDLDLHHQVRGATFDEGVGRRVAFGEGREVVPGPLADVERAVGLHSRAGRLPPPPKPGAADALDGAGDGAPRGVHDVAEDLGQVLVGEGGRHQGDDPAHRVEADPAEAAVPVDGREFGDGAGVGAQDVDGGAQRPGEHGGGVVHGGCASVGAGGGSGEPDAAGRRPESAPSSSGRPCGEIPRPRAALPDAGLSPSRHARKQAPVADPGNGAFLGTRASRPLKENAARASAGETPGPLCHGAGLRRRASRPALAGRASPPADARVPREAWISAFAGMTEGASCMIAVIPAKAGIHFDSWTPAHGPLMPRARVIGEWNGVSTALAETPRRRRLP